MSALVQTMNVKERWVYNFSLIVPHHKPAVLHHEDDKSSAWLTNPHSVHHIVTGIIQRNTIPMGTEGLSFVMACMLRIVESLSSF